LDNNDNQGSNDFADRQKRGTLETKRSALNQKRLPHQASFSSKMSSLQEKLSEKKDFWERHWNNRASVLWKEWVRHLHLSVNLID
jgi:hypothetical protein